MADQPVLSPETAFDPSSDLAQALGGTGVQGTYTNSSGQQVPLFPNDTPPPDTPIPTANTPTPSQEPAETETSETPEEPSTNPSPQEPVAPATPPLPQTGVAQSAAVKQYLSTQDQAFQQDLMNGHITPQTYQSMFASQNTLGKMGTLFGLLVGGIGSGGSTQNNAMLQMMNQNIHNDLDAQKTNVANKQNLYNLVSEQESRAALERLQDYQGQLTQAQILSEPNKRTLLNAQAGYEQAQTAALTQATSYQMLNRIQLHQAQQALQKIPQLINGQPNPVYTQAAQAYNMTVNFMGAQAAAAQDAAAAKVGLMGSLGAQQDPNNPNTAHENAVKALTMDGSPESIRRANLMQSTYIPSTSPGHPGTYSALPLDDATRNQLASGSEFLDNVNQFRQFAQQNGGSLNPQAILYGQGLAKNLADSYRRTTAGGSYAAAPADGVIDQLATWASSKNPTAFLPAERVLPPLNAVQSAITTYQNAQRRKVGAPLDPGSPNSVQTPNPQSQYTLPARSVDAAGAATAMGKYTRTGTLNGKRVGLKSDGTLEEIK